MTTCDMEKSSASVVSDNTVAGVLELLTTSFSWNAGDAIGRNTRSGIKADPAWPRSFIRAQPSQHHALETKTLLNSRLAAFLSKVISNLIVVHCCHKY